LNYVRLTTIAAVMGVTVGWLRGLVYQRVMDDMRENPVKGSPYVMHVPEVLQAVVAYKMRRRNIGYDLIRDAIDKFEIDRKKIHVVPVDSGIDLVMKKPILILQARNILKIANDWEHGEEEVAA
jgi:hypothetical protein